MKITDGRTPLAQHCNVVAGFAGKPKPLTPWSRPFKGVDDGRPMKALILDMCESGRDIEISEINRAWPNKKSNSLAKAVSDLVVDGLLERVERGVYRKI